MAWWAQATLENEWVSPSEVIVVRILICQGRSHWLRSEGWWRGSIKSKLNRDVYDDWSDFAFVWGRSPHFKTPHTSMWRLSRALTGWVVLSPPWHWHPQSIRPTRIFVPVPIFGSSTRSSTSSDDFISWTTSLWLCFYRKVGWKNGNQAL